MYLNHIQGAPRSPTAVAVNQVCRRAGDRRALLTGHARAGACSSRRLYRPTAAMQTAMQQQIAGPLLSGHGLRPRAPPRSALGVRCSVQRDAQAVAPQRAHAALAVALGAAAMLAVTPPAEAARATAPPKADPYAVSRTPPSLLEYHHLAGRHVSWHREKMVPSLHVSVRDDRCKSVKRVEESSVCALVVVPPPWLTGKDRCHRRLLVI